MSLDFESLNTLSRLVSWSKCRFWLVSWSKCRCPEQIPSLPSMYLSTSLPRRWNFFKGGWWKHWWIILRWQNHVACIWASHAGETFTLFQEMPSYWKVLTKGFLNYLTKFSDHLVVGPKCFWWKLTKSKVVILMWPYQRWFWWKHWWKHDNIWGQNIEVTISKVMRAAAGSFKVLRPGGHWRIAVPDAYFPKYLASYFFNHNIFQSIWLDDFFLKQS